MIYRDLPVFVGLANQSPSSINNNYYLMASQVSVDMSAGGAPKRKINQLTSQYDQFTHPDPLISKISFQSYIPGSIIEAFNPLDLVTASDASWAAKIIFNQSTGNNYHAIKIGTTVFDKCYLESYTVDINPLRPVTLSAQFTCNNPPTGYGISGLINGVDSFIGSRNFSDKIIHGHTCTVSGVNDVVSNIQSSIKYQVTCQRTPVYKIGSIIPSSMILDFVERQMDIDSTNINSIINQEGSMLQKPISIGLRYQKDYSITAYLNMNAGSKVLSQKINMQEGDTLSTQVSIKEILNADETTQSITPPPSNVTYSIIPSRDVVDEGEVVIFTVNTTNVADYTTLYYSVQNITSKYTDFIGETSGKIIIQNNTASFNITINPDLLLEDGPETFKIILSDATFLIVKESQIMTILDTSFPT